MCASPAGTSSRHTPLWLSHHWPEHYDRCVRVGGLHVCRRCLVLYPVALATILLVAAFDVPFGPAAVLAMWLLPLPMVAEWVLEHAGRAAYSPVRQAVLAALAAPALGIALAEHLRRPFTPAAVAPVVVYVTICAVSALWASSRRPDDTADWELEHEAQEAARVAELQALLTDVAPTATDGTERRGAVDPAARHDR